MSARILVVDDDEQVRDLVLKTLKPLGHEVVTLTQANEQTDEVLARLRSEHFDLLIAGGYTPPRDDDLTLRVRRDPALPHLPVIVVQYAGSQLDFSWSGNGELADMYLSRPFHPKELAAFTKRLLSVSRTG